jgi:hypothetical protein
MVKFLEWEIGEAVECVYTRPPTAVRKNISKTEDEWAARFKTALWDHAM